MLLCRLHFATAASSRAAETSETTRANALVALQSRVPEPERLEHAVAVEAIMRKLARATEGDPDEWGLAGLLHDIDRSETDANPSQHGIVGARLLAEHGFSDAIVHAVETHDDVAGRPRTLPIAHALYCADRTYWAILSSGLRRGLGDFARATPAAVIEGLQQRDSEQRIDERLRRECAAIGLTLERVLELSLDAMRAMPD